MKDLVSDVFRWNTDGFSVKARLIANIYFYRINEGNSDSDNGMEKRLFHIVSGPATFLYTFDDWYSNAINELLAHLDNFCEKGSNWIIDRIQNIELKMNMIEEPLAKDDFFPH